MKSSWRFRSTVNPGLNASILKTVIFAPPPPPSSPACLRYLITYVTVKCMGMAYQGWNTLKENIK